MTSPRSDKIVRMVIKTTGERVMLEASGLKTLQDAVGGLVEVAMDTTTPEDDRVILLVNEEGLLLDLPANPVVMAVFGIDIVGDAVLLINDPDWKD